MLQRTLCVNSFLKIILSPFAKFVILNCDLSNELVVVFELLPGINIIIIEFHPRSARIAGGTNTERRHAPAVHIQGAIREEEQEQAVGGFARVGEVLAPVVMVDDAVEGWRVQLGERGVCVLAMEAFLVAIDHRFPIEFAFVFDAPPVWPLREVDCFQDFFQSGEEFFERGRVIRYRREDEAGRGDVCHQSTSIQVCGFDVFFALRPSYCQ